MTTRWDLIESRPATRFDADDVIHHIRGRKRRLAAFRELLGAVTFALAALATVTVEHLNDAQLIALSVALLCLSLAWALLRWGERA